MQTPISHERWFPLHFSTFCQLTIPFMGFHRNNFCSGEKKLSRTGEISSGTIAKNCFSSSLLNFCLIIYRKPSKSGKKMLCFFPLTILSEVFPRNQGKLPRQDPTIAITKIRVLGGSHWLKASRTSPCLIFL